MNAHIPQSYEATSELQEIAAVPMQIIRPRDGTPVIGVVQDALAGAYLATREGNFFTRREFMNMMMKNKRFQSLPSPKAVDKVSNSPRYTGQQIIETLLAPINIDKENSSYDMDKRDHNFVRIREGEFLQGILDKKIFNDPGSGILHTTYNDYGPKEAVDFLDGLQSMMETYLIMKGFSVGVSDLIADESTKKQMEETIVAKKKEIDDLILQVHMDLFTNNSGKSNQEEFEAKAIGILNKATGDTGKIGVDSLSNENRLMAMIRSGSKGDKNNVAQMIACVGQQAPEGRRIPYGFTDRTLPHYKMYDDGAEARGFVEGSFLRGLTPQEFFFHAMSGREGLIDTAVKTADTGYTQRQLIKAMEDLMIQHDGTVRDGTGKIVQFRYGEDGVNSTKIEKSSLPLEKFSEATIRTEFGMEGVDLTTVLAPGTERGDDKEALDLLVNALLKDRRMLVEGVFGGGRVGKLATPLNLERLLLNIKIKFNIQKNQPTNLTPIMVLEGIDQLIERTQSYNKIWVSSLRFHLAPHKLVVKERFTKEAWEALCAAILLKNWKAWAIPGELVGIVAAQSIGEPATQMSNVYDTFTVISTPEKTKNFAGKVGFFIDKLLEAQKEDVVTIGQDSVVLDLKEPMYILGVSNNEKSSWLPISQVSRHTANGGLVEVHTRTGRKTTATLTHSFLKRSSDGIVPVLGSKLELGMRIPVAKTIPIVPTPINTVTEGVTIFTLNELFGWVCGMYLADGSTSGNTVRICKIAPIVETRLKEFSTIYNCIFDIREYQGEYGPGKDNNIYSKDLKNFLLNTFKEGSYKKEIGSVVYHAPLEFIQGLVSGFFDGDGNINVERQLIRASSRSRTLLEGINRLLGYCSMFGVLSEETSVRIPGKIQYTLIIPRKFAEQYQQTIGFNLPEKAVALDEIVKYNSRLYVHSNQEMIDKIPELGPIIAETGLLLRMPGQSRTYGRWLKKESIGRATLENYVQNFKEMMAVHVDPESETKIIHNISILESALNADVFWDEITDLVYLDDPKTYVYDFTVPGNDSFMVDDNIFVHNTLNTFHQAGVAAKSAMTRGVPRLKELLKVTKNPKAISLTITLKPEFRNDKDMLRAVAQDLELTLLKDIVTKAAIYYDPSDDETILEEDKDVIKFFKALEARKMTGGCGEEPSVIESVEDTDYSNWLIRFVFDREKMFNKNITMDDVYFVIQNAYAYYGGEKDGDSSIRTIYTDYNSQKLIMRIRPKKGHAVHGDNLAAIKKLQNLLLQNTIIRGVPGIRSVTWRKDNNRTEEINGEYKSISQYLLDTDGSNFVSVMIHPAIDGNKLYSTNVHDIYDQLGIEATRAVLYSEINGLFDDADINYRHLGLLCDSMTHAGRLMSVDRYGINKSDNGPLAKACFEETEKVLRDAAIFGEMDPVTGVSANIMMGQTIRAGTAFTQILLDEEAHAKLLQNTPIEEEEEEEEEDVLNQDDIDSMLNAEAKDMCSQIDAQMNLVLPTPNVNMNEEEEIELVEM